MPDRLIWDRDGGAWPNRAASRFISTPGVRWHVQVMGSGPVLLLVHGTGASSHSWSGAAEILARHFTVVIPDLPGHAFTSLPYSDKLSLPGMAKALADLMSALDLNPEFGVGHSAGAAILMRMTMDGLIAPQGIVSVNGAMFPFKGVAGKTFSPLAKLIALNPFVPKLVAWRASSRHAVENLLLGTGSISPKSYVEIYEKLFSTPQHVAGTLGMMACWDLDAFVRDFPKLKTALLLIAADNDRTIAPQDAIRVSEMVRHGRVERVPGLGHLAHEERPEVIVALIEKFAAEVQVIHQ